jgi:hypothetical protein
MENISFITGQQAIIREKRELRDRYDALNNCPQEVRDLVNAVVEEAGYDLGTAKLTSNKTEFRTVDVYGYALGRNLAVVQFRRTITDRRPNRFGTVQKRYALIGEDDGQLFCHILQSSPRRMQGIATASPESVVRWAESKIFGVPVDKLDMITRQCQSASKFEQVSASNFEQF